MSLLGGFLGWSTRKDKKGALALGFLPGFLAVFLGFSQIVGKKRESIDNSDYARLKKMGPEGEKFLPHALNPREFPMLNYLGTNLTLRALEGKTDPTIGREGVTETVLTILDQRMLANPCLVGEPGVGKTAIVEGVAARLAAQGKVVISVDVASMVAGTGVVGRLEERMQALMDEVERSNGRVVLFVDEVHMIVGAGATRDDPNDVGNIVKSRLARRGVQCIGATTIVEFKRRVMKDRALKRRMVPVGVAEPSRADTLEMVRGAAPIYGRFHRVTYPDAALEAAVDAAAKVGVNPDASLRIIDHAGARTKRGGGGEVDAEEIRIAAASLAASEAVVAIPANSSRRRSKAA